MLSSFNTPHKVDVPVRDLDEPDDDLFLAGERRNLYRFMDLLDYANQDHNDSSTPRFFRKLRNLLSRSPGSGSYELSENHSDIDFFDIDDDEDAAAGERTSDLRKYQITRLERKLNKTILCFACGLVFVFGFLFLKKDGLVPPQRLPQKVLLSNSTHDFHPTTLLISLDGFHPHYINAENTPALHRMLVDGYGAPYMVPSFPSLTFPNHWTMVTGLYPADHGIVGNTFFDPLLKKQFINTNPVYGLDPQFWQGGEPVWTTAAKQGVRSAIHMWPGSEVPGVGNNGPMFVDKFNGTEPLAAKADRVFSWLDIDDVSKRPELILAYVPTIDQFGHKYGISGPELTGALRYVDEFVELTQDKLRERNLQDIVNVIVVSDHGMAPTSKDRLLFLDDVVAIDKIEHIDGWPLFGLRPRSDHSVDEIYLEIEKNLAALTPDITSNFSLYRMENFPSEWQFGGDMMDHKFNYRLAPLWIVPNVGYSVTTKAKFAENNNEYYPKGVHGYNNTHLLMRAIFLGQGPYFEEKLSNNKKVLPFTNVNVYDIVCDTLHIEPSPNNGTLSGKEFSISSANHLPENWSDDLMFPDLPYEVDHIVRNATYDQLWRSSQEQTWKDTTEENYVDVYSSLDSFASSMPVESVSMPGPGDFIKSESISTAHSVESGSKGFFGDLLSGVGDVIEDIDDSLEDALEDALEYADSWFDGEA